MINETRTKLAEFWRDLVCRLDGNDAEAEFVYWEILAKYYTEPHRHYHTLEHILKCSKTLHELVAPYTIQRPEDLMQIALFFHDVIYDPKRKDNEERSSDVCVGACALVGIDRTIAGQAARIILATKHTGIVPEDDRLTQWVLDVDLSSLGAPPEEFDQDSANIRKEYNFVPDDDYRKGRVKILQSFLDRPRIYFTDACHDRFEEQARANLERAIRELST